MADSQPAKGRSKDTRGVWQALSVSSALSKGLIQRGFKQPTPIQRASLPLSLGSPARDVLGMARTGSGKTLAYLIPLIQRLAASTARTDGPRALILCPSRELAVQVLKVGKDLARGVKEGSSSGAGRMRWSLIIGGEALDKQFATMSSGPDIVIATPGRFLHICVEMKLDLRSVEMVIYDEADRLFEMGFDVQLREIVHRLPTVRQSLLFSATLPSSVAEFARAGLTNPALVRLDAESSLSPDLKLAFFRVAPDDKSAALLVLLDRIMRASPDDRQESPQAIIFVATKHHVEYINAMLEALGYATSHVYGSLDQLARQRQLRQFRERQSNLLVVTDVAARGLDIPVMDNVINYDFPASSRVFIHRVGRTARAGRRGAAWSLITSADLPYVCDLATTVSRDLFSNEEDIVGDIPRHLVDEKTERLASTMDETAHHLKSLRQVMQRGESMVQRSRSKASINAYREAKVAQKAHARGVTDRVHPIFALDVAEGDGRRLELMAAIGAYAPRGTVLEAGRPRDDPNGKLMQARRQLLERRSATSARAPVDREEDKYQHVVGDAPLHNTKRYHDPDYFMSHTSATLSSAKKFSLSEEGSFSSQLRGATVDMAPDEAGEARAQKASQLRWDRKRKRFSRAPLNSGNEKMIRSESGALLPATFNSGRFDTWKKRAKGSLGDSLDSLSRNSGSRELLSATTVMKQKAVKHQRKMKNARPPQRR